MGILILVLTFKIREMENIPTSATLLEGSSMPDRSEKGCRTKNDTLALHDIVCG